MSELDELTEDEADSTVVDEGEVTGEEGATPAQPEAEPEPEPAPQTVPLAALQDERRKRQELEAQIEQLRDQSPKPDIFEDPDAVLEKLKAEVIGHADQRWINASRAMVMASKPDYVEREAVFMELTQGNPSLVSEMMKADNPALFAYETARKHAEYQDMQNVDDLKAKMRAEIKAELEAEMGGSAPRPSLATTTAAGTGDLPSDDDLASLVLGD